MSAAYRREVRRVYLIRYARRYLLHGECAGWTYYRGWSQPARRRDMARIRGGAVFPVPARRWLPGIPPGRESRR